MCKRSACAWRVHMACIYAPEEPRRGCLVARHVALAEGVHVDTNLVEATEWLEDPDAVRLGLVPVQVQVVLAEGTVRLRAVRCATRRARAVACELQRAVRAMPHCEGALGEAAPGEGGGRHVERAEPACAR